VREEDDLVDDLPVRELLKILPLPAPGYICVRTPDRPGSVRCVLFLGDYVRYGCPVGFVFWPLGIVAGAPRHRERAGFCGGPSGP
jgi:hypothetical protein